MKLTESQLRQFIKEAIEDTFNNFDDNDEFSEYDNMSFVYSLAIESYISKIYSSKLNLNQR